MFLLIDRKKSYKKMRIFIKEYFNVVKLVKERKKLKFIMQNNDKANKKGDKIDFIQRAK